MVFSLDTIWNANALTTLISVLTISGFMYRMIDGVNKKNSERAAIKKKEDEEKARTVKEEAERNALIIKQAAEENARIVKDGVDLSAKTVKQAVEDRASVLELRFDQKMKDQGAIIDQKMKDQGINIDKKFDELQRMIITSTENTKKQMENVDFRLTELTKRADLTNGNIKHIRGDISGVEEDVADIFDSLPRENTQNTDQRIRDKQKARRKRREEIEDDAYSQRRKEE